MRAIATTVTVIAAVALIGSVTTTAYAEYCVESNGGTLHCFPDSYNSNDIDYSYQIGNGCYIDAPHPWSDGHCYSYPEPKTYGYDRGDDNSPSGVSVKHGVDKTSWTVTDSKGNQYSWELDRASWDSLIIKGHILSLSNSHNPLLLDGPDGETVSTTNLDGFVYGAFDWVAEDIYGNSHSDSDFVYEIWHIASQLTDYGHDRENYIGDEGRYALDTLARGGGDCEDLVILIADMLKSSKHTDGWTIQYVYMDGDNPTDPQEVNHVMLYVNDGTYDYLIEATGDPSWYYYPDGIDGWFFDV